MYNSIIAYSILTFVLLFFCAVISYKLNLVDLPNKRKTHSKPIAYTGGVAISVALLCALQIFDVTGGVLNSIISIAFLVTIVGFVDDKYYLNTGGKLSLQIIPILYLIVYENLNLLHIGDYNYFLLGLGSFSIPFSLLSVLFLINAFNYFDGIDGSLGFTTISVLAILYFLSPNENIKLFLITTLIPVCIFLCFNFSIFKLPKLFLGDSGSLLLGFIVAFILIYFANQKLAHPILLAWSVAIFVYEFLSINLLRLKNEKNPFQAGQDHLHHILFIKNKSIFLTNLFMVFVNIIFFTIGYISFIFFNPLVSLFLFALFFIIFFIFRNIYSIKKKR
jgi:UDP-GlcNAc:undecaprenyl-phosphate/decaprenyl-phosphate GlcNAc-1-phosphate transferase